MQRPGPWTQTLDIPDLDQRWEPPLDETVWQEDWDVPFDCGCCLIEVRQIRTWRGQPALYAFVLIQVTPDGRTELRKIDSYRHRSVHEHRPDLSKRELIPIYTPEDAVRGFDLAFATLVHHYAERAH